MSKRKFIYIFTFLKAIAKIKFAKISNKAEVKELAASNWKFVLRTCDIHIYHRISYLLLSCR